MIPCHLVDDLPKQLSVGVPGCQLDFLEVRPYSASFQLCGRHPPGEAASCGRVVVFFGEKLSLAFKAAAAVALISCNGLSSFCMSQKEIIIHNL